MNQLLQKLKKYFVPHSENDHRPHILRREAIAFVIAVAVIAEFSFLFGTSYIAPRSRLFGVILTNALVDGTNQNRVTNNVRALRTNPLLQAAAQEKADDMANNGYFAHTSPAGVAPWHWFEYVGYRFIYAGENLAVNFSDSKDVVDAWMNSSGHRRNILDGNFTEVGIATAQGEFKGQPAIYVVELFGAPAAAPIARGTPQASGAKPASVPTVVAERASRNASSEQTFVAVKGAETQVQAQPVQVASPVAPQNNPVQNAAAAPRQLVNDFYFLIIGLFALALALHVFVKIRVQHPKLIFSGMLVIAVAALCIVMNQHIVLLHAAIL